MADYGYADLQGKLFKIVYDTEKMRSTVKDMFRLEQLFQDFKRPPNGQDQGGRYYEFALNTQMPTSAGFMATNGTTRTPDTADYTAGKVYLRQLHGTVSFEKAGMVMGKGQMRAFADIMEEGKDQILRRIRDLRIKGYFGGNAGTVATVKSNVSSSTTVYVDAPYGFTDGAGTDGLAGAAELFRAGDKIVLDPSGTPQYATIASVDESAGTITLGSAITITAGKAICFGVEDEAIDYGYAMDGLADLYASGVTYEGINPATAAYAAWNPTIYTAANAGGVAGTQTPLTSGIVNKILVGSAHNDMVDCILANPGMQQSFLDLYESQMRWEPGVVTGGMRELNWDNMGRKVKFFFDYQVPHYTLFGLPLKECYKFVASDGEWLTDDGNLLKWVASSTRFQAVWFELRNFGTKARHKFVMFKDIEEAV